MLVFSLFSASSADQEVVRCTYMDATEKTRLVLLVLTLFTLIPVSLAEFVFLDCFLVC